MYIHMYVLAYRSSWLTDENHVQYSESRVQCFRSTRSIHEFPNALAPIRVVVSKIIPLGAWVLGSTASEKVRFHIILWSLWFCTVLIVTLELHIDNVICLLTKQSDYIERSSFERSRTSRRTIALTAGSETYDGAKSCRTNSKSQQPNPKPIQSFLAWLEWLECLYFSQRAPFIAQNICKSPELSYSALTPCTTTSTDLYFLWT